MAIVAKLLEFYSSLYRKTYATISKSCHYDLFLSQMRATHLASGFWLA